MRPSYWRAPIHVGLAGVLLMLIANWFFVPGDAAGGLRTTYFIFPGIMIAYGLKHAMPRLLEIKVINALIKVWTQRALPRAA
jgi:hypothetical protein